MTIPIPAQLILDPCAPIPAGMGVRAQRRLAELRDAYATALRGHGVKTQIKSPEEAASILRPYLVGARVESLYLLALNVRCQLIQDPILVSRGDDHGTDCGVRNILRIALTAGAASFILGHNHPSGWAGISQPDKAATRPIVLGGDTVGCPLNDHIILVGDGVVSMRRECPELFGNVTT